ncbi:MAG: LysR family transcriptional regulator [Pseudomonadota bacterium]
MDKFAELNAFTSVVEKGGFSAAAREMGQSRSSVNRLVLNLEARLGVQLLSRTTRSVSATSTGQALFERARQVLDDLAEIEAAVSSTSTEAVGKLRLSAPPPLGELDFSDLITRFMQAHPAIEIEISFESRLVDPIAEGFDIMIRIAEPDEETTLVDHRVLTLTYLLCASPSYLAAQGRPESAPDLRRHAILHHGHGGAAPSWALEGPSGPVAVPVNPLLCANGLETLLTAARAGLGIAVMPEFAVRSDLAAGRLERVLGDHAPPPRMLQVIYPPARHLSAKVRLFVDFVRNWCAAP